MSAMTVEIPEDAYEDYGHLHRAMQRILDAVETGYAAAGILLPERRFTAVGDVASSLAIDCEQVTVNFVQLYVGEPGQPNLISQDCLGLMSADFVVQVTRCVPILKAKPGVAGRFKAPPIEEVIAATKTQAVDAQLLFEIAAGISSLQGKVATVIPSGSDGGYQSVAINISMSLFED